MPMFHANQIKDTEIQSYKPAPPGRYKVILSELEIKDIKGGIGTGVSYKMEIVEGECSGKTVYGFVTVAYQEHVKLTEGQKTSLNIGQHMFKLLCLETNNPVIDLTADGMMCMLHKPFSVMLKSGVSNYKTRKARENDPSAQAVFENTVAYVFDSRSNTEKLNSAHVGNGDIPPLPPPPGPHRTRIIEESIPEDDIPF